MIEIRYGSKDEVENLPWANLYDEDNEGDYILIAECDGRIAAWAQVTGAYIYFIESNERGAGTAIVNWMKDEYGYVQAVNCSNGSESYWNHQGFVSIPTRGRWPNCEWEAE